LTNKDGTVYSPSYGVLCFRHHISLTEDYLRYEFLDKDFFIGRC